MVAPFGQNLPFHSHFHTPFTSDVKPSFNIWPVILTASLFFTVLSWYNFLFSLYEYYFRGNTPEEKQSLKDSMWSTLLFAGFWTLITVLIYFWLSGKGWLTGNQKIQDSGDSNDAGGEFTPTVGPESISSGLEALGI